MSPIIFRVLVLVLIFGATMLAIEGVASWFRSRASVDRVINHRLKLIASGMTRESVLSRLRRDDEALQFSEATIFGRAGRAIVRLLHGAALPFSAKSVLTAMGVAAAGLFLTVTASAYAAGYTMTGGTLFLALTFALAAAIGLPMMVFARLRQRRRKRMEEQFPVALDTFVRGLRAGHPVSSALHLLTTEMKDPIGSEFGIVSDEVSYGSELRDALLRMAERWDMNDIHMFVVSLSVQSETGGNLAEILENLSAVIRERASLYMKVRALSSEGRMTAWILTALPVMAFVSCFTFNPAFYLDVAQERSFMIGFSGLLALYVVGLVSIRRMIDLKV